jgi:hypothetical protein
VVIYGGCSFLFGGHFKINFHVLNNFTKNDTRQNMLGFRGMVSLLAKLLMSQVGIILRRPSKALSKLESIPYTLLSLNKWFCKIQDWVLEATKTYEVASTVEYKPYPPNLMGREAILHWRSPKNRSPPTTMSSTAARNSLLNKI